MLFLWVGSNPIWLMSIQKENIGHRYKGTTMWGHNEMVAACKPNRELSREDKSANTLSSDFQPPELRKNKILFFKPPRPYYLLWQSQQTSKACLSGTHCFLDILKGIKYNWLLNNVGARDANPCTVKNLCITFDFQKLNY